MTMNDFDKEAHAVCAINITVHVQSLQVSDCIIMLTDMVRHDLEELQRQAPYDHHFHTSHDKVREALLVLFDEGTVTEARQWYAIYCVLVQCAGYPAVMSEFCKTIDALHLDVQPPCQYESWRKMPNELAFLPKNVRLWDPANPQMTPEELARASRQIAVAARLIALLE